MATHIEIADTDEGEKIDSAALLEGISAVGYVVLCVLPDSCKLDRIFLAFLSVKYNFCMCDSLFVFITETR